MKQLIFGLKWRKLILVSILVGGIFGAFDADLFTRTAFGNAPGPDGCADGTQCKSIGCSVGPGGSYCTYYNIYGGGATCPGNIPCPNLGEEE